MEETESNPSTTPQAQESVNLKPAFMSQDTPNNSQEKNSDESAHLGPTHQKEARNRPIQNLNYRFSTRTTPTRTCQHPSDTLSSSGCALASKARWALHVLMPRPSMRIIHKIPVQLAETVEEPESLRVERSRMQAKPYEATFHNGRMLSPQSATKHHRHCASFH